MRFGWWENVAVFGFWRLVAVVALATTVLGQTTVRIAGRVTDAIHEPVGTVSIELKVVRSSETISKAVTDQNGKFVFLAVPPGSYELNFTSSGFRHLVRKVAAVGDVELPNIELAVAPIEGPDNEAPSLMAPVHKILEGTVEPIHTTLCEIVQAPKDFDGKIVVVRAQYVSKFEGIGLEDDRCSANVPLEKYHPLDSIRNGEYAFTRSGDDLSHSERLKWTPVQRRSRIVWIKDQNYRQIQKYAGAKFRWPDGGLCLDCPLYRVTATFAGRFDYFETRTVAYRGRPGDASRLSSAGDPNDPLLRILPQSESDVEIKPVDPTGYSASKRRVSNQEAHELVHAYLGRAEKQCPLEEFHSSYYPEFVGYQALSNSGGSIGYFLIDPRTADVWNGVICERFRSSPLEKLQRVLRQRIGLSEDAYTKIKMQGPMCEPGMPRVSLPR